MPRRPRSVKQQMDRLTGEMRERGMAWREIARVYQTRYRLPPLRAFREAHRMTQAKVVETWNTLWPDDTLSERRLGAWEAWPGPSGHEPSVTSLNRLARIYQCRTGDLVNGEDHRDVDAYLNCGSGPCLAPASGGGAVRHGNLCTGSPGRPAAPGPPSVRPPERPVRITVDEVQSFLAGLPSFGSDTPLPAAARLRDQEFGRLVHALTQWADRMKRRDVLALIASAAAAAHAAPPPYDSPAAEGGRAAGGPSALAAPDQVPGGSAVASGSPMPGGLDADAMERLVLAVETPSRVDSAAIEHIQGILHHSMRQEDILGPQAVLETVLAQYGLVRRLLTGTADDELTRRLLSLLADISRFTGWLLFNQGDYQGSEHYYSQARRAAHEADDDSMSSYVLAQWSHLATWCGDPRLGVEHALGALAWAQRAGSRSLTAYANDVGARAYAAVLRRENRRQSARDGARVRSALSAARSFLDGPSADDPGRDLVYFYDHGLQLSTRAECLLALRDADQAIAHTHEAMKSMGAGFPRNLALAHLDLCQAYAQKREVDRACTELGKAARLADRHRSRRLVLALQDRRRSLSPWQRTEAVMRLDERLDAYGLWTQVTA